MYIYIVYSWYYYYSLTSGIVQMYAVRPQLFATATLNIFTVFVVDVIGELDYFALNTIDYGEELR